MPRHSEHPSQARPLPETSVVGSNPTGPDLPSNVVSIGAASAAIVNRLAAMRRQDNRPQPPAAA